MIDWSELVEGALQSLPENVPETACSHTSCGNKEGISQNVGTQQAYELKEISMSVPTIPTVTTTFEGVRVGASKTITPSSFYEPVGGGVKGDSAPWIKPIGRACMSCAHLYRPGLSDGLCGERDDLAPAYGPGHPLRKPPADGGETCPVWELHPGLCV